MKLPVQHIECEWCVKDRVTGGYYCTGHSNYTVEIDPQDEVVYSQCPVYGAYDYRSRREHD